MARLLMGVASPDGTAPEAAIPHFEVAGKTGTSKKVIDGKYSDRASRRLVRGLFPGQPAAGGHLGHRRRRRRALPRGRRLRAKVAAPSFKHIGEQLIQYLDIKPVTDLPRRSPALGPWQGGRW